MLTGGLYPGGPGCGNQAPSGSGGMMAAPRMSRRTVLCACVSAISAARASAARADEAADPDRDKLPQPGDLLVEAGVDAGTSPLKPSDIGLQEVLLAWAFDP